MKLRKGMQVVVIAGKDRGKKGTVEEVLPERDRIRIGGVNLMKKAVKATGDTKQAGIVEFPAPIHASNVMAVDPKSGERTRIGYQVSKGTSGKARKVRIAKKSGKELVIGGAK
ncbi:MAG TPA: 50S ribosomal protein L24 [Patescibacteria group bacterium]|jgi:large subunit ribosomal protein L24